MLNVNKINYTPYKNDRLHVISFAGNADNNEQSSIVNPQEFIQANRDIIEFSGSKKSFMSKIDQFFLHTFQHFSGNKSDVVLSTFLDDVAKNSAGMVFDLVL